MYIRLFLPKNTVVNYMKNIVFLKMQYFWHYFNYNVHIINLYKNYIKIHNKCRICLK